MTTLPSQTGKLAIITGGNRGLGFEIALALAGAGAQVLLGCRDDGKARSAIGKIRERHPQAHVESLPLDVADLMSVRRFAATISELSPRVDLLIHNAAAIMVPQGRTRDGFELHLGTNHLGPFALTGLLLERLEAAPAARVVNMASLAHQLTQGLDPNDADLLRRPYKPMDAYGRSKLATLLYTFELDRRLRRAGCRTLSVAAHPGYAATNPDLGGFFMRLSTRLFAQSAEHGAWPALHAATAPGVDGGDYYGPGGFKELSGKPKRAAATDAARDPETKRALWELSERLTGISYLDD